jgi:DNA polymerase
MTSDLKEKYAGLDYETWSRTDLKEHGLDRYVKDPEFRVLLASTADVGGTFTYDFVFNCYWQDGIMQEQLDDAREVLDSFEWDLLNGEHSERTIMAHNASFERAVTKRILPKFDWKRFQDSAVDASMLGVERKLEVATRQLSVSEKLAVGQELVQLFCVPNEFYPDGPTPELIEKNGDMEKWMEFVYYCEVDAAGSREIRLKAHEILDHFHPGLIELEAERERDTYQMNQNGWYTDIPLVQKMKQRSWANGVIAQRAFINDTGDQLNFNSHPQMKKYLEVRGVKTKSLDKYHLPNVLKRTKDRIARLEAELHEDPDGDRLKNIEYAVGRLKEAEAMLETKMEIGGSTLTKLPVILNTVSADNILRDQYIHVGAAQTFRTSARGAQLQNLKKLDENIRDMSTLYDFQCHWSNGDMADQLRQIFESRHPEGELLVGDFGSVESRGLGWLAQEDWKIEAYRKGLDVYKVLATKFFGIEYDEVDKVKHRPRGKYSELSCGYQSSAQVLQDFMFKLGYEISIEQALEDVTLWRQANPAIVEFWHVLDNLLRDSVMSNEQLTIEIGHGLKARATPFVLPSVTEHHPGAVSLCLQILKEDGSPFVTRFVHGLYFKAAKDSNRPPRLCYYKPAERLSQGDLWIKDYAHKTKKHPVTGKPLRVLYSIYGGKLAGIYTQSFCREMFFHSMHLLFVALEECPNAVPVGQFHDEIAVDWWPMEGGWSKERVWEAMEMAMSVSEIANFPLVVEVKSAHRYIK